MAQSSQQHVSISTKPTFKRLISLILVISCFLVVVRTQTVEELSALSDEELEQICLDRGFELVQDTIDETTGQLPELTHEDYIEAAQRCLQIEQEMNEILEQNPELAIELEDEIERMKNEKERLEVENEAKRAEIAELQRKLETVESETEGEDGTAFVAGTQYEPAADEIVEESEAETDFASTSTTDNATVTAETAAMEEEDGSEDEQSEEPESEPVEDVVEASTEAVDDNTQSDDILEEAGDESVETETTTEEVADATDSITDNDDDSQVVGEAGAVQNASDFTLKAFYIDFVETITRHIGKELKTLIKLILPVARPILNAGDTAWRHIATTLRLLRKQYERMQQDMQKEKGGGQDDAGL